MIDVQNESLYQLIHCSDGASYLFNYFDIFKCVSTFYAPGRH
jgi:hypothetical protein